eukprot:748457-Hanusia_phi.AAC.2
MAVSFRRRLIPPLLLLLLLLLIHAASVDAVAQQEEDRWQEKDGWQDLATERSGQSDLKRASRRVKSARSSELCAGAPCAPARPFFRPPTREPCNAGGGAVVYSSHCAPFPYSSVVGIGESYSNRMQGGASGPFDVQSVGLPLAHPAVAGLSCSFLPFPASSSSFVPLAPCSHLLRSLLFRRDAGSCRSCAEHAEAAGGASRGRMPIASHVLAQAWIASAIAAGVAAPGRGAAMPVWSEVSWEFERAMAQVMILAEFRAVCAQALETSRLPQAAKFPSSPPL